MLLLVCRVRSVNRPRTPRLQPAPPPALSLARSPAQPAAVTRQYPRIDPRERERRGRQGGDMWGDRGGMEGRGAQGPRPRPTPTRSGQGKAATRRDGRGGDRRPANSRLSM